MRKSITIIGAGLGGLTAGALLAKDGYRVTLLEQHSIVGGCATTFKRKGGFICEVGLHEMDGVYDNPTLASIFERLGVYDHVTFVKAPEFFKVTTKKRTFIMPDGIDKAKEALIGEFPHEKEGIEKYFKLITAIAKQLTMMQNFKWYHFMALPYLIRTLLLYANKSVMDVMDRLFGDEELKLILNTNVGYYNDTPKTLSFLLHAVAQHSYYTGGGWFIKGGSGRLSDYLSHVIIENGGEVITKAMVTKCDDTTVHYTHKHGEKSIKSDKVISNLSPQDTYKLYHKEYQETRVVAESLLTIYMGFSQNLKEIYGEGCYSNFMYNTIDSIEGYDAMAQKDIGERGFVFVDYSQIDADLAPSGKSFGVVCMDDSLGEWEGLDIEAYEGKKIALQQSILAKLEHAYPNISKYVEYIETGTAKTMRRYTLTPHGTAYGFKPTPKQFLRIPQTKSKIKNLFFVGQWVTAGGFSPCITSGYLAHRQIVADFK